MKHKTAWLLLLGSALALAAFPLLAGCTGQESADGSAYDLEWGSQESFADIGAKLKTLGITDEFMEDMEKSYSDMDPQALMNKTAVFLTALGGRDLQR